MQRAGFYFFRTLWSNLHRPLAIFIPLLLLNIFFFDMGMPLRLYKLLNIAVTISFATILVGFVNFGRDYVIHLYDLSKADNLRERKIRTQLQFVRRMLIAIIVILTVCAVLLSFDSLRRIGAGLLTGVGIGGIIIGFAAQKSLGNLLAGFQIAFTQPLRIDDALLVEGEFGRVEEITLTYVVLNLWDQRRLILPINYFIEKPFQNWTRTSSELIGTVMIYLDYSAPMEIIRTEFNRLLAASDLWDKRVGVVQVTDASDKTIEIRMLVSAENSGKVFDLRCYIRENLISFIQQNYPGCLPRTRTDELGHLDR